MSTWMLWLLLSWITGSPLGAAAILLLVWWLGDRVTFRLLPDPFRLLSRSRRTGQLRRTLAQNPHDRRARFELATLLLDARRPAAAAEVLRPNVEAGDEDVHTAYTMGAALARSGQGDAAERVLAVARAEEPGFRSGELDLELGRLRVRRGDFPGAREALERLVALRPGSVEGRYWLSRALAGAGDGAGARRVAEEAWREYSALPRFQRARERPFAWRLRPWRPALVAAGVVAALALLWLAALQSAPG
ncbi:MAG TPA: tetratricopeptide repeat protein [Anaeromyxobacter sp.]|nr:tetratricopeptide repeat protein [Anaeromyxobacter sp.]